MHKVVIGKTEFQVEDHLFRHEFWKSEALNISAYLNDNPELFQKLIDFLKNPNAVFPATHVNVLRKMQINFSPDFLAFETREDCEQFSITLSPFTQNWIIQYADGFTASNDWIVKLQPCTNFPDTNIYPQRKLIEFHILPGVHYPVEPGATFVVVYPVVCNRTYVLEWQPRFTAYWGHIFRAVKEAAEDRCCNHH